MKKINRLFTHRFGPLAVLALLIITVSFITRLILFIKSWPNLELNFLSLFAIFIVGLFYDLVVWSFFSIPLALYIWWMKDSWYQKKWQRLILFPLFFINLLIIVFNAGAEIVFWDEFNVRFNFIAVDYLIYTTEVIENIFQSYNMPLIIGSILLVSVLGLWLMRRKIIASQQTSMRFGKRTLFFFLFLLLPLAGYFLVNNQFKNISNNNYVNELSGNGIYEFGSAFWNNEIDYNRFYAVRSDEENIKIIKEFLQNDNASFTSNPLSIERVIQNDSAEKKWNIILISVESYSGDYMKYFGNKENITPYLDSLIPHSLFFENFYASGTRTVRGLEALSLAIPPTPGQSIVRRPNNGDLFTMGNVLNKKGYDVKYIYGGNAFFDNMGKYFGGNGYQVLDKRDVPDSMIHLTTAWGIDDEAAFNYTLQQCDESYKNGHLFFNHIMTISNHRPYTYPDGKIDISPQYHTINGAVKYTDYAINKFLQDAQTKPWFNNTVFVIVADHCAKSAGKTDLPINRYHIPCLVYAPQLIKPTIEKRLTSQIDLVPTILGLMHLNYTSRFMGYDLYKTPIGKERVFISTYQDIGYVKGDKMVVLSPQRKINVYRINYATGNAIKIQYDSLLVREAIAWYQGASLLIKNGQYNKK